MPHHRYHRRPRHRVLAQLSPSLFGQLRRRILPFQSHIRNPQLINHNLRRLEIQPLINRRDNPILKQLPNQRRHRQPQRLRQLIYRNGACNPNYLLRVAIFRHPSSFPSKVFRSPKLLKTFKSYLYLTLPLILPYFPTLGNTIFRQKKSPQRTFAGELCVRG